MTDHHQSRVLFTATLVRGHIAKFHIPYLRWFQQQGWETWVAACNDYPDGVCEIEGCDHYVDIPFPRNPFSPEIMPAYSKLKELLNKEHFDIIHTHTPVGSVLTRLAARKARKAGTKVIYTAHGFHFYDGAPIINWLLWYPIEKIMSRFTDVLVTINQEDYERACRFAHCRVKYVPGVGINLDRFSKDISRDEKRASLGINPDDFLILSIGDLIPRKNQSVIIEALKYLDSNFKLFICGTGPQEEQLKTLAQQVGVADRVQLLGFRDDVDQILHAADTLVFPSLHEGLPVSVLEAMASCCPVIAASIRGITPDLLEDGRSAILLPREPSPDDIAKSIQLLSDNPELAMQLAINAYNDVFKFDEKNIVSEFEKIYRGTSDDTL